MNGIRNNRRILGAIVLSLLCVVATSAPAAAFDGNASSLDHRLVNRISVIWDQVQTFAGNLLEEFGDAWLGKDGARVDD